MTVGVKIWAGNSVRPLKFTLFSVCLNVIVRWVWGASIAGAVSD